MQILQFWKISFDKKMPVKHLLDFTGIFHIMVEQFSFMVIVTFFIWSELPLLETLQEGENYKS